MPRRKKSSDDESESPEDDSEEETKKKKRKAPAKRAKKDTSARGKKSKAEEEEEEDVEDDDMEPADGYASDLMGDDADRKHLASLPQVQREGILYERSLKRQEAKERMEARKKFRATQKKQEASAKPARKAAGRRKKAESESEESEEDEDEKEEGEEDDDEGGRTRGKRGASQREKQSSALSDLRARRNKAETSKEPSAEDRDRERREQWKEKEQEAAEASGEEKEGEESESESEDDRDRRHRHRKDDREDEVDEKSKVSTPVTLNDILAIQMKRSYLDKVASEPYFEEYVTGTFVRLGLGASERSGVPVYRCCEVFGVQEANRTYRIMQTDTKNALLLRFGKAERQFKMHLVSNQKITQQEFDAWVAACQKDGVDVISKEDAIRKKKSAERLRKNYVYTPDAVSAMIRAKNATSFRKVNTTLERAKLEGEKLKAEELGDKEAVAKLQQRLDDLDEYEAKLKRQASKSASIADLNKRAILMNNASLDKVSRAEAAASTQPATRDPFRRRRTAPVLTWVGARPISEEDAARKAKEDQEKAEKEQRDKEKKEAAERAKRKGLPVPVSSVEELVEIAAGKEEGPDAQSVADLVDVRARDPDWQMLHDAYATLPLRVDLDAQPAARPLRISRPVEPPRHVTKLLTLEEYEMRFAEEY